MRSDYGLYGVAVICFIIAGAFMVANVPGYTLTDTLGIAVIIVFFLLGLVSAAVGYSARPKAIMPTPQPIPAPTPTEPAQETPPQLLPTPAPPTEEVAPEPPPPTPPEPSPPPVAPPTETEQPVTVAAEEKPKEKPVRRRRKKAE